MSGAGITSVMSCAAGDVLSEPADYMAGCMRDASESRPNVESGDSKVKELAVTTSSIWSIEDCIISARAFNSAKVSLEAVLRRGLSST